jgi:hypothetical protein
MVLLQIRFDGFHIVVVIREVGCLLLRQAFAPQALLMVSLVMGNGVNDKTDGLRGKLHHRLPPLWDGTPQREDALRGHGRTTSYATQVN